MAKKIIKTIAIIIIAGGLLGLLIFNSMRGPSNADQVWDEGFTVGDLEAKNYYIAYADLMCPYCIAFENALLSNEEVFEKQYIEGKDILFEVRMTDFLYEFGETHTKNSRWGAEASYCARNEGKFWDFYREAIGTIWNDFFAGASKETGFKKANELTEDSWIAMGEKVGLSEKFADCVRNDETVAEIEANTNKALRSGVSGMPYFKFNDFTTGGFDLSWGWEYVQYYLEAGLGNNR